MSETKKECKEQLKYLKDNKIAFLKNISITEYNKRIAQLREYIYKGTKTTW
jgi:uncharacterized small protein (DUF1192 family)